MFSTSEIVMTFLVTYHFSGGSKIFGIHNPNPSLSSPNIYNVICCKLMEGGGNACPPPPSSSLTKASLFTNH